MNGNGGYHRPFGPALPHSPLEGEIVRQLKSEWTGFLFLYRICTDPDPLGHLRTHWAIGQLKDPLEGFVWILYQFVYADLISDSTPYYKDVSLAWCEIWYQTDTEFPKLCEPDTESAPVL